MSNFGKIIIDGKVVHEDTVPCPTATEINTGKTGGGLRFNKGKLRFDLVNPHAHEGMVRVLTKGANKYADHNWERGMKWDIVLGCLKRHLNAIEKGEDYDIDENCADCKTGNCVNHTGELHVDLLQCNAHFLSAYYRIYPQGDNRWENVRPKPKIGLDIDEVLANWVGKWCEEFNMETPTSWYFDKDITKRFEDLRNAGKLDELYMSLEPLTRPEDIPFEPHCYVTSRPVDTAVTLAWLEKHGYPLRPVITVPTGSSKVQVIKEAGVDIFIDDRYENFEELNRNGICCFLFDAPHNQRYKVGFKRIKSLKELKY